MVCGGIDSAVLLRPLGLDIPLAPVYGYSISAPIREPLNAPRSGLMDERYKVAISRLGNRVRVAGRAELVGYETDISPNPDILTQASRVEARDHFPDDFTVPTGTTTGPVAP